MSWLSETVREAVKFAEQAAVKDDALGPIEFWLNRYQGLLGAGATLLAGWLAYRAAITTARRAERLAKTRKESCLTIGSIARKSILII
jgi:glucose-6-phosphate dehydrogenase assembly protein OpcA